MPPTLAQVQQLHTAMRAGSARFASYNFQQYFLRRTDERFAGPLATLGDTTTVAASKDAAKLDDAALEEFVAAATRDTAVVERAGTINAMFKGDKLVVEGTGSRHGA